MKRFSKIVSRRGLRHQSRLELAARKRTRKGDTLKLFGDINRQAKQEKPRRCYTDDFKAQAVTLASSIGQAQAARKLSMPVKTLSHWVEADRQGSRGASPGRRVSVSAQESELSRLRAENATLRREREILKKATAFFAKASR
jgi:transposase